jgi:hypothetical protein
MDWYLQNLPILARQYPNQWLAILGQQVVAYADTPAELAQVVRERGLQGAFIGRTHPQAFDPRN